MATSTAGTAAGRPQPQTTVALESPGGPFIRYSEKGRMPQYTKTGIAWGGQITTPLVARPGYYSSFRLRFAGSGGVNGTHTVTASADAPYDLVGLLQFKDAFGTVIFAGTGYALLYLVPLFSGGFGTFKTSAVTKLPSYSAVSTGATGTGDFSFATALPLEFARGMGVIAGANAALPPSLSLNLNTSATFYGATPPGTVPTIKVQVDSDFYWLPEGVTIEPPGLGTTRQWIVTPMNPTVGSKFSGRVQGPRLGGFLDTILVVMRNATGARIDGWPGFTTTTLTTATARFQVILDGVPIWTTTIDELLDDMAITWPTVTRPKGVVALSRRTAMNQSVLGLLTSGEQWLASSPGTLLELAGYPWGTFAKAPAQLSLCLGQIVPAGTIIQGATDLGI